MECEEYVKKVIAKKNELGAKVQELREIGIKSDKDVNNVIDSFNEVKRLKSHQEKMENYSFWNGDSDLNNYLSDCALCWVTDKLEYHEAEIRKYMPKKK